MDTQRHKERMPRRGEIDVLTNQGIRVASNQQKLEEARKNPRMLRESMALRTPCVHLGLGPVLI